MLRTTPIKYLNLLFFPRTRLDVFFERHSWRRYDGNLGMRAGNDRSTALVVYIEEKNGDFFVN